jgi:hypothetical protein
MKETIIMFSFKRQHKGILFLFLLFIPHIGFPLFNFTPSVTRRSGIENREYSRGEPLC